MRIKTFAPIDEIPKNIILPDQIHGANIVEIITGEEDLAGCDGIFTKDRLFVLGVRTADCAPICFYDNDKFGIVHAGWRGFVDGICQKMLENFNNPKVFAGPYLPQFEIQKDFCYEKISSVFEDKYFNETGDGLLFDFQSAILEILPMIEFDGRVTYQEKSLASWRRDKNPDRNITVIGEF